jgi:integrase
VFSSVNAAATPTASVPVASATAATVRNGKGGRYRVAPAHPELVDAFRSVPHRSLGEKVFTGRTGNPLSPRTAARWISEGITHAGLQAAATGTGVKGPASHSLRHSLRHSCARHWLQSGLNVNAVSTWLGHRSPTVTLNTCLVLAPDTLGDISEVL